MDRSDSHVHLIIMSENAFESIGNMGILYVLSPFQEILPCFSPLP